MLNSLIDWVMVDVTGVLVNIFFIYTIIIMILDSQKPPLQTCLLTGFALIALSLGGSYTSSATASISVLNGLLWLLLGYQRYSQPK